MRKIIVSLFFEILGKRIVLSHYKQFIVQFAAYFKQIQV
jgi:hypothetical protein